MSFSMESVKSNASARFNNVISKGKDTLTEVQENPKEFLNSKGKIILIAAAFFTSLVLAPFWTGIGLVAGFLYNKNVCKVENELKSDFFSKSFETKVVSGAILTTALLYAGKIALPLAVGAHVGMLLSKRYEAKVEDEADKNTSSSKKSEHVELIWKELGPEIKSTI